MYYILYKYMSNTNVYATYVALLITVICIQLHDMLTETIVSLQKGPMTPYIPLISPISIISA